MDSFWALLAQQLRGVPVAALCLVALCGSVAVFLLAALRRWRGGVPVPLHRRLLWCLVLFYLCFVAMVTLLNREAGSREGISTQVFAFFAGGKVQSVQQFVYAFLNVVLFVPWGLLLALLREEEAATKRLLMVSLTCFLSSFAIELAQLATARGYFELEDLVANTLGGFVGALAGSLLLWAAGNLEAKTKANVTGGLNAEKE